jgi:hypothetical protein
MFSDEQNPEPEKRNSGRTGPTSTAGREKSARNGMCATTLIMLGEVEEDWLELLQTWLDGYQNPEENSLLYTFVLKTAQAEWHRLRLQREFDFHMLGHGLGPIAAWEPHEVKNYDLILRYLTAAERRFQREYRMLEHHWKTHHKQKPAPDPEPDLAPEPMPECRYINSETGESVDDYGNHYPPPPDWKPQPIIPGVYPPDHPASQPWPGEKHRRRH